MSTGHQASLASLAVWSQPSRIREKENTWPAGERSNERVSRQGNAGRQAGLNKCPGGSRSRRTSLGAQAGENPSQGTRNPVPTLLECPGLRTNTKRTPWGSTLSAHLFFGFPLGSSWGWLLWTDAVRVSSDIKATGPSRVKVYHHLLTG